MDTEVEALRQSTCRRDKQHRAPAGRKRVSMEKRLQRQGDTTRRPAAGLRSFNVFAPDRHCMPAAINYMGIILRAQRNGRWLMPRRDAACAVPSAGRSHHRSYPERSPGARRARRAGHAPRTSLRSMGKSALRCSLPTSQMLEAAEVTAESPILITRPPPHPL